MAPTISSHADEKSPVQAYLRLPYLDLDPYADYKTDPTMPSSQSPSGAHPTWPTSVASFDYTTMDARFLRSLLLADTKYASTASDLFLDCIESTADTVTRHSACFDRVKPPVSGSPPRAKPDLELLLLRQCKLFRERDRTTFVSVTMEQWIYVLQTYNVLPSFLEVLHNNNGGFFAHVSYSQGAQGTTTRTPESFHIGLRCQHEIAVYARYDLVARRTFALVLEKPGEQHAERLYLQQDGNGGADLDMFTIVISILSSWIRQAEVRRRGLDVKTQELEAMTGYTHIRTKGLKPLDKAKLQFSVDLMATKSMIETIESKFTLAVRILDFLGEQLTTFQTIAKQHYPDSAFSTAHHQTLISALNLQKSLAHEAHSQLSRLALRVAAQQEVTKILMTQRDTELSIQVAKAAARDSQLMKAIAIVTMVFLPMTSIATFFSMSFFQVTRQSFSASSSIWIPLMLMAILTLATVGTYFWWAGRVDKRVGSNELMDAKGA